MYKKFRLEPETAILVVIDLQDKLLAAMPEDATRQMMRNVEIL